MDTSHWPQEIVVKPIEEIVSNVYKKTQNNQQNQRSTAADSEQRKPTSATTKQPQQIVNCPRCNSTNTKFCYYNNYSLTQPRYFCKTCRRYWTEGGSLRNIPVGGATRKNNNIKRPNSSNSSSPSSKKLHISSVSLEHPNPNNPQHSKLVPNQNHGQDLNLTFSSSQQFRSISEYSQLPTIDQNSGKGDHNGTTSIATNSPVSAIELWNGIQDSRGFSTFMPMPNLDTINTLYSSGHHQNLSNLSNLHEFKPSLNFSLDHHDHNGYSGNFQDHHDQEPGNGGGDVGRNLFPFEDLKQVSNSTTTTSVIRDHVEQINNRGNGGNVDSSGGYWSGMLGGGSW